MRIPRWVIGLGLASALAGGYAANLGREGTADREFAEASRKEHDVAVAYFEKLDTILGQTGRIESFPDFVRFKESLQQMRILAQALPDSAPMKSQILENPVLQEFDGMERVMLELWNLVGEYERELQGLGLKDGKLFSSYAELTRYRIERLQSLRHKINRDFSYLLEYARTMHERGVSYVFLEDSDGGTYSNIGKESVRIREEHDTLLALYRAALDAGTVTSCHLDEEIAEVHRELDEMNGDLARYSSRLHDLHAPLPIEK